MSRMNYRPTKAGWVVRPESQPVFRGVYRRCHLCHRKLNGSKFCAVCHPSFHRQEES